MQLVLVALKIAEWAIEKMAHTEIFFYRFLQKKPNQTLLFFCSQAVSLFGSALATQSVLAATQ
jgi:hypothetical protein